ncbi:hypothetical protein L6654_37655 [Bradyrhizobium sp. WYCCWR 13023]|uniref:Uncharacterized protein n=1 Tax=Bradyrhizobium zhengyangense TaxID=2911009 RepID=A0A9X1RGP6_9BRAD|nr:MULTISPECIES: hypothetical protein [Bradyrhizobium]MCG2632344.1 hypothetical protein [Bradyrhizobium zhengyangense]MCG2673373.1 hypothetical protein [Bradyrhizobium zhengyangense]MDA9522818.1 hypothetical protein [Bradyrhizobium sp. CCBAU 11434]
MLKERATANDLARLITDKIGVAGLKIAIRPDHAYGWVPTVISAPADPIGFQRRAEEIAHRLRVQFDLAQ